jgi:tellurite resistance protein TerC
MILFWLGFFALVAALLAIDLGVLHRKQEEPTMASALGWTIVWVALGLAFSGVVYLMYDRHWGGATLHGTASDGSDAAINYISAYLLEQALSVDNLFVMSLVFTSYKVPPRYQHRVLFWGILGAIVFRLGLLKGGQVLASRFDWIFYIFGAYLGWQGFKLLRESEDDEEGHDRSIAVRLLRPFFRIVDADKHGWVFSLRLDGRRALTTLAICLVVIELTDIVFALDSIPAVMSVSTETFIMVTSNIFAILGLRSLYFVLAGAMAQFKYLKIALAILLMVIAGKMIAHDVQVVHDLPDWTWLVVIAGILSIGVVASMIASRGAPAEAAPEPDSPAT